MKYSLKMLIIIMFSISVLYGEGKGIKLVKVYEKTFNVPIVDVIFDAATVSIEEAKKMGWKEEAFTEEEKNNEKVPVSYPKVVLVDDEKGAGYGWYFPSEGIERRIKAILFYDKTGALIKELEIGKDNAEYVYLSPQKKHILVSKIPTEYTPEYSGGILYNTNGEKIWEIKGLTPIAVSDEGYAIATYLDWQVPPNPGGDFYVYDSTGKLIKTIKNPLKEKTAPFFAKFSKDGSYAILTFEGEASPPTAFILIEKSGRVLWKESFREWFYTAARGNVDVLPYKGILGITMANGKVNSFLLDWKGNLKWTFPIKSGYGVSKLTQDGKQVYICTIAGHLWSIKRKNGKVIWGNKIPYRISKFTEMYIQSHNIVIKGDPSKIFIFDNQTGELKGKIAYPDKIYLSQYNGNIFVIKSKAKEILGLRIKED